MEFINKCLYCLTLLIIIGCSPVSSTWSCKGNVKGSCKTINEIENDYSQKETVDIENSFKDKINNENIKNKDISSFNDFRSKESVARVVFAPYVDTAGNRHDVSTVYYLEQKAEWRK